MCHMIAYIKYRPSIGTFCSDLFFRPNHLSLIFPLNLCVCVTADLSRWLREQISAASTSLPLCRLLGGASLLTI